MSPSDLWGFHMPQWVPMGLDSSTEPELSFRPLFIVLWDFSPGCSPLYLHHNEFHVRWTQSPLLIIQSTAKCLRKEEEHILRPQNPTWDSFYLQAGLYIAKTSSRHPVKICRHLRISKCRKQRRSFLLRKDLVFSCHGMIDGEKSFLQGSSLPAPPPSQMGPDLHDPDKANLVLSCLTRSYNTMCVTSTTLTKFTLGKNMLLILTKKYHLIFLTEHLLFWCTTPVFSFMMTS